MACARAALPAQQFQEKCLRGLRSPGAALHRDPGPGGACTALLKATTRPPDGRSDPRAPHSPVRFFHLRGQRTSPGAGRATAPRRPGRPRAGAHGAAIGQLREVLVDTLAQCHAACENDIDTRYRRPVAPARHTPPRGGSSPGFRRRPGWRARSVRPRACPGAVRAGTRCRRPSCWKRWTAAVCGRHRNLVGQKVVDEPGCDVQRAQQGLDFFGTRLIKGSALQRK